jgi:hypothetical protein
LKTSRKTIQNFKQIRKNEKSILHCSIYGYIICISLLMLCSEMPRIFFTPN